MPAETPVAIETQPDQQDEDILVRRHLESFCIDSVPAIVPGQTRNAPFEKLFEVAPIVFPEHKLINELKQENIALHERILCQYWYHNTHKQLFDLIQDTLGHLRFGCSCMYCFSVGYEPSERNDGSNQWCGYKTSLLHLMGNAGLTYHVPVRPHTASLNGVPVCGADPDFDPVFACKHLSHVSNIDAHIVFIGPDALEFVFGRPLWMVKTVIGNPEISKLDLFRASLISRQHRLQQEVDWSLQNSSSRLGSDFLGRF